MNDLDLEAQRVIDGHPVNAIGHDRGRRDAQRACIGREAGGRDHAIDHAKLNTNPIAAEGIRAVLRRVRFLEWSSIARMLEVLQHDRAKRCHARFPLRTATSSARIESATSGGVFPPMSRPIGE